MKHRFLPQWWDDHDSQSENDMKEGESCKSKHPEPKQKVNLGICNFQHDHKESANLFVDDVETHDTKAVELLLTSSSTN